MGVAVAAQVTAITLLALLFLKPATSRLDIQDDSKLALRLYQTLRVNDHSNMLMSPLSLKMALATIWLGANSNTEEEIASTLSLPQDRDLSQRIIENLSRRYMTGNVSFPVKLATKLFLDNRYNVKKNFTYAAHALHLGNVESINIQSSPEAAIYRINNWVEAQTFGRIKELFSKGSITSDTVMILANALYFKALWETPFDAARTKIKMFHTASGVDKPVEMMKGDKSLKYAYVKQVDSKILQLPYGEDQWGSMIILLPQKKNGLTKLENGLTSLDLDYILQNMEISDDPLYIELPKFKMSARLNLVDSLKRLGVQNMFERSADFSRLIYEPNVNVDKVVQSLFIEVTEEGSEGASATGTGIINYSLPTRFVADHPFIFLIRDDISKSVIFIGRYTGPEP